MHRDNFNNCGYLCSIPSEDASNMPAQQDFAESDDSSDSESDDEDYEGSEEGMQIPQERVRHTVKELVTVKI